VSPQTNTGTSTDAPDLHHTRLPNGVGAIVLTGDWTTVALAPRVPDLSHERLRGAEHPPVSWDLSGVQKLDQTGALLLWRAWGRSLPDKLLIPMTLEEYFAHLPQAPPVGSERFVRFSLTHVVTLLGNGALGFINQLRDIIALIGRLLLDLANVAKHPQRWPGREISAGVYRGGAQALGILGLVGFLIGVVLSYLSGDQLRRFGAEIYVVNLLGNHRSVGIRQEHL